MFWSRKFLAAVALCAGSGWWMQPVAAQTPAQRGWEPVDQVVEDTGPLRHSLRRVAPGLGVMGQESQVYRRPGDGEGGDKLFYIGRGVIAEFDRSQYVLTPGGRILQEIPPNTVFHIARPRVEPPEPPPDHPLRVRARVDRRVRSDGLPAAMQPRGGDGRSSDAAAWLDYRRTLDRQQRSVIEAVKRAISGEGDRRGAS